VMAPSTLSGSKEPAFPSLAMTPENFRS
jgi:hypothetical protein